VGNESVAPQDEISFPGTTSKKSGSVVSSFPGQQQETTTSAAELAADSEISLAVAVSGLQASVNRLLDVFERFMATTLDDGTTARRLQVVQLVHEMDDGLSAMEKEDLIKQFMEKPVMADTYLLLRGPDLRRAWIQKMLGSQSRGAVAM